MTGEGKARSHAPDFLLRRGDGSAVVVDCCPAERRRPRDLLAAAHAALAGQAQA